MNTHTTETLRSNFLIHWTGKDIDEEYKHNPEMRQAEYVTRLQSTLVGEHRGLWMNKTSEHIGGGGNSYISYDWRLSATCFSEIKLSDVYKHTERYGSLGFGFTRDFVIERYGAPVHYVSGTDRDVIVSNYANCWEYLDRIYNFVNSGRSDPLDADEVHSLQAYIRSARIFLDMNMSFVKNMSDSDHADFPQDFTFLDEAEWRIIRTKEAYEKKLIRYFPTLEVPLRKLRGENYPDALIPFDKSDLRVLIFPDSETKKMAFQNPSIRQWFGEPSEFSIIATVQDCSNF